MDAVTLARAQFAFTVSFHFLFPSFSIGLASYLVGSRRPCGFELGAEFTPTSTATG